GVERVGNLPEGAERRAGIRHQVAGVVGAEQPIQLGQNTVDAGGGLVQPARHFLGVTDELVDVFFPVADGFADARDLFGSTIDLSARIGEVLHGNADKLWVERAHGIIDFAQCRIGIGGKPADGRNGIVHAGRDAVEALSGGGELGGEGGDVVDDRRYLLPVNGIDQAFGGGERRIQTVGNLGNGLRQFPYACQETVNVFSIIAQGFRKLAYVFESLAQRGAGFGHQTFELRYRGV